MNSFKFDLKSDEELLNNEFSLIDRDDVFNKIDNLFELKNSVFLCSPPGTGKTATAIRYGNKLSRNKKYIVKWFDSSSTYKMIINIFNLAGKIGINKFREINIEFAAAFNKKIADIQKNFLFIFDNVENDPDIISIIRKMSKRAPVNLKFFFTSKHMDLKSTDLFSNFFELNLLKKEEAIELINVKLGEDFEKHSKSLDLILDLSESDTCYVPSKLIHIISYLKFYGIEKLNEFYESLINLGYENIMHRKFHEIFNSNNLNEEKTLLSYIAYLNGDFITVDFLKKITKLTSSGIVKALDYLASNDLLTIIYMDEKNIKMIKIHEEIQNELKYFVNLRFNASKQYLIYLSLMIKIEFEFINNKKLSNEVYMHAIKFMENFDGFVDKKLPNIISEAFFCLKIADFFNHIVIDQKSNLKFNLKRLSILKDLEEQDRSALIDTLYRIGLAYKYSRDFSKSIQYFSDILAMYDNDVNIIDKLTIHQDIVSCCMLKQDYHTAIKYSNDYLELWRKAFGNDPSLNFANTFHFMGKCYGYLNEYENALDYLKRSLKIKKNFYKNDHDNLSIASTIYVIGDVYYRNKASKEAISKFEQVLNIFNQIFKNDKNTLIAEVLFMLGKSYIELEDYENSIDCLSNSLKIYEKYFDDRDIIIKEVKSSIEKANLIKEESEYTL